MKSIFFYLFTFFLLTSAFAEPAKTREDGIASMISICAAHNGIYPEYTHDGLADFMADDGKIFSQAVRRLDFHPQYHVIMLKWAGCIEAHNGNEQWKNLIGLENLSLYDITQAVRGRYKNVKELSRKLMELNGAGQEGNP